MKALLQRVNSASVKIKGDEIARIGPGLCVLVGIAEGDSQEDIDYLVVKMVNLRIFSDHTGKFNFSAAETGRQLLVVSQFTLIADTHKGRRPSFTGAAAPDKAEPLYEKFLAKCSETGLPTYGGVFGAYMQVEIVNDGPVTIMLDSRMK